MKGNHITHCLVAIAAAVVLLVVLDANAGTLGFLAVALACPLMMVLMMRGMMGGHTHGDARRDDRPTCDIAGPPSSIR